MYKPWLALSIAVHVFLVPSLLWTQPLIFSTPFCGKSLCYARRQLSACCICGELAAWSTLKGHSYSEKSWWGMELGKVTEIPQVRSEGLWLCQCCQSSVKMPLEANGPG